MAIQVSETRMARYFYIDIGVELALIRCIVYRSRIIVFSAYHRYISKAQFYESIGDIRKSRKILQVFFFSNSKFVYFIHHKMYLQREQT